MYRLMTSVSIGVRGVEHPKLVVRMATSVSGTVTPEDVELPPGLPWE